MQRLQGGVTPERIAAFENPYLERVLAGRKRAIGEEFGRQSAALTGQQSAMDAFRTGRTDLARSRLGVGRLRALEEAEGTTRAEAYDRALAAAFQQSQQDIGAMGQVADATGREIGALSATGAVERGVRQAGADFDYGQFLERRDWDVNNLGVMLQALQATNPAASTTTTARSKPNVWGQAIGGLATIAGAYFTGGASLFAQGAMGALGGGGGVGAMGGALSAVTAPGGAWSNEGLGLEI